MPTPGYAYAFAIWAIAFVISATPFAISAIAFVISEFAFAISEFAFAISETTFAISATTFAISAIALDNAYLQLRDFQEINYPKFIFYRFLRAQSLAPLTMRYFFNWKFQRCRKRRDKKVKTKY